MWSVPSSNFLEQGGFTTTHLVPSRVSPTTTKEIRRDQEDILGNKHRIPAQINPTSDFRVLARLTTAREPSAGISREGGAICPKTACPSNHPLGSAGFSSPRRNRPNHRSPPTPGDAKTKLERGRRRGAAGAKHFQTRRRWSLRPNFVEELSRQGSKRRGGDVEGSPRAGTVRAA
jgi:hypothetical protein